MTGFRDCISLVSHGERIKRFHTLPENSVKSLNWLAPELLEQNLLGYNEKSDVYSVGVTICELCNGIEPFSDMKTTLMLIEKIRGNQPSLLDFTTCPDEENIIIGWTESERRIFIDSIELYSDLVHFCLFYTRHLNFRALFRLTTIHYDDDIILPLNFP